MHHSPTNFGQLRARIGHNIHQLRHQQRCSIAKLARKSGVSAKVIDDYELGRRNMQLEYLLRIAQAFKIDIAQLITPPEC